MRIGIVSFSILFALAASVEAGKGSSSRSSSSTRSSSSRTSSSSSSRLYNKPSSGGYSKPAPPPSSSSKSGGYSKPSTPSANNGSGGGYNKPQGGSSGGYSKPKSSSQGGSSASSSNPTAFAKGNRFDSDTTRKLRMEKSQKSLASYEAEKSKFKTPPPPVDKGVLKSNPVVKNSRVYSRSGYDDVIRRRTTIYGSWHPPVYVYHSAPYYGSWDSTFLWWALLNDSSFFHHHRSDPAITAWHNDAMKLSQENGELKAQIATLDEKVEQMEKNGVARNDSYLPAQVAGDPVVALSAEAIAEIPVEKPTLRVATGIQGGQYSQVGQMLKTRSEEVKIELVSTSGAEENLKLIREGKVDAAIIQSDVGFIMGKKSPETTTTDTTFHRATLYSEYVMLIVSKDSSIQSVGDLSANNTIYVGPEGSGSALTWIGFEMQDKHYKDVKSMHTDYQSALEKIAEDKTKAMLFVAGVNTPLLTNLSNKDKYKVIPVDDIDLSLLQDAQGHTIYDILTLPAKTYSGLQDHEIQTLGVDAEWTISDKWIDKYGEGAFDEINYSVIDIVSDLHRKIESTQTKGVSTHTKSSSRWLWVVTTLVIVGFGLYWLIFKFNLTKTYR